MIALTGALLVWWLRREPQTAAPPTVAAAQEAPAPAPTLEPVTAADKPPARPLAREVRDTRPPHAPQEAAPKPTPIEVPKDWLLRGSNARSYELRTDLTVALNGHASATLMSHDKDVHPNLSGSAMQALQAAPYLGLRVEYSVATRTDRWGTSGEVWMYATDPAGAILVYQTVLIRPEPVRGVRGEWHRHRIIMDVPTHADVLAFGFSVRGMGKLWADDVQLSAVDRNVPLTVGDSADPVGVMAQTASSEGALPRASNLDFEYFVVTRDRQAPPPPDTIDGRRF
jgi:hypothetical protein